MQKVESSLISEMEYQADTEEMFLRFKTNNRMYRYENVPPEVFAQLQAAPSKGKYFRKEIMGKHTASKIEEEGNPNAEQPSTEQADTE